MTLRPITTLLLAALALPAQADLYRCEVDGKTGVCHISKMSQKGIEPRVSKKTLLKALSNNFDSIFGK